ncbi:MAG TPA: ferredoxin reductase [Bryobacteraceae bacterium]|jgi:ferredoxin-NADP reductase|nr:ferredoxin reductase [Bryobacteraceae bacterium]
MARTAIFGRVTWHVGTVVALHDETTSARTLTLEVPDWPGHVAGQHVDVRLTAPDGYSAARSYSIASAPNSEKRLDITVERLPDGEVSPYLTQQLKVDDQLELRGPIGGWFLWRPEQTEPIQLIAGGSGIVPLIAMIRSRAPFGSSSPFRLLYSVREPAAVFYCQELCTLADRGIVRITYAYTRAVPQHWPLPPGRINADLIANATWPSTLSPTCYICGPTPFVESAAGFLSMNGHSAQNIRTERFGPTGDRR